MSNSDAAAKAERDGLDHEAIEPCGDCGDPVAYDEAAGAWRHVFPARPTCWMVHGNGGTLNAKDAGD